MVKKSLKQEVQELKEQVALLKAQVELLTAITHHIVVYPAPSAPTPVPYMPYIGPASPIYPNPTFTCGGATETINVPAPSISQMATATCPDLSDFTVWSSTNSAGSQQSNLHQGNYNG